MTFGPPRFFVPICIRHRHGFIGGSVGYQEVDTEAIAVAWSPMITRYAVRLPDTLQRQIRRVICGTRKPKSWRRRTK